MLRLSGNPTAGTVPGAAVMLAGLMSLIATPAHANPAGATIGSGTLTIAETVPGTLEITQQTTRGLINWQSFSIAAGETTRFIQPSTQSVTVNRVTGGDLSTIAGNLEANGRIFLLNPNGILFTPSATVDVNSLVATTLDMSDADLANASFSFSPSSVVVTGARVENQGTITVDDAGLTALVAPQAVNSGTIQARLGTAVLASESTVSVDFAGDGLISFAVDRTALNNITGLVDNSGTIDAAGGAILLSAAQASSLLDSVVTGGGTLTVAGDSGAGGVTVATSGSATLTGQITAGAGSIGATANSLTIADTAILSASGGTVSLTGRVLSLAGQVTADAAVLSAPNLFVGTAPADAPTGFSFVSAASIAAALSADSDVTLRANDPATATGGNIQVGAAIQRSGGNAASRPTLTVAASNDVTVNAVLSGGTGLGLNVALAANSVATGQTDPNPASGTLRLNAAINSNGGNVTLTGAAIETAAAISTTGANGGAIAVTASTIDLGAGLTTQNANATLTGTVRLTNDATLSVGTGRATLAGPVVAATVGPRALTIAGNATIGTVGGTTPGLSSLSISGAASVGGVINTAATQTYDGAVTLVSDTSLTGSVVDFGGTVAATTNGGQGLTITGDAVFGGAVGAGQGRLSSLSVSGAASVGGVINTTATQTYDGPVTLVSDTSLSGSVVDFGSTVGATADGWHGLTITGGAIFGGAVGAGQRRLSSLSVSGTTTLAGGSVTTAGEQNFTGAVTLASTNTLTGSVVDFGGTVGATTNGGQGLSITGDAIFGGAVGTAVRRLSALSVTGTTSLAGGSITTAGEQNFTGAVTLASTNILTASTVDFGGTVGATTNGGQGLTITGNAIFGGAVGGGQRRLSSLLVTNAATLAGGSIATTGEQRFTGAVKLASDSTLIGRTVIFGSTVAATTNGGQRLDIAGNAMFSGAVGAGQRGLSSLLVTDEATLAGGSITTTGAQKFSGAVTLASDTSLTGSKVYFDSTVAATTDGGQRLDIAGDAMFSAAVGAGQRGLSSLLVTNAATLAGGSITTTGAQKFSGAVTLASDTLLTGSNVYFDSTVAATTDGGQRLDIAGGAIFRGAVGAGQGRLSSLSVADAATLAGGSIRATQTVQLDGAVTLAAPDPMAGTLIQAGTIVLKGAVDGQTADRERLALDSGFDTSVTNAIGRNMRLARLTTDKTGSLTLAGVNTVETQDYAETKITLSGDFNTNGTLFRGQGALTLAGDVGISTKQGNGTKVGDVALDGVISGDKRSLTIDGAGMVTLAADSDLGALTILNSGTISLGGKSIVTDTDQIYGSLVQLGQTITLSGRSIDFQGGIDAAPGVRLPHLSVTSNGGDVRIGRSIGVGGALGGLTVNAIRNSVDGPGGRIIVASTTDNSLSIVTQSNTAVTGATGDQFWNADGGIGIGTGAVTMMAGGGQVTLSGDVSGGRLRINTAGSTTLTGKMDLTGLTSIGAGEVTFGGTDIKVTSLLDITGPVRFNRSATVQAGDVDFKGALTTAPDQTLTLRAVNDRRIPTGGTVRLPGSIKAGSLDVTADGGITLAGGSVAVTDTLSLRSPLFLSGKTGLTAKKILLAGSVSGGSLDIAAGDGGTQFTAVSMDVDELTTSGAFTIAQAETTGVTTLKTRLEQSHGGPVILGNDTVMAGSRLTFAGRILSADNRRAGLQIDSTGIVTLRNNIGVAASDGAPGTSAALGRLKITARGTVIDPRGGTLEIRTAPPAASAGAEGGQHYHGPVYLGGGRVNLNVTGQSAAWETAVGGPLSFERIVAWNGADGQAVPTPDTGAALWLLLGTASVTSNRADGGDAVVEVAQLAVRGNGGIVDLSGSIRNISGAAAAQLIDKNQPRSNSYRFNKCAMGSPSCIVIGFADLPAPESVRLPPFQSLPNLDLFAPSVIDRGNEDLWLSSPSSPETGK